MPAECRDVLDKFTEYLLKAYGKTRSQLRRLIKQLRQKSDEPPISFLSRIITIYFLSKGEKVLTIKEISENEEQSVRDDVTDIFLEGLKNEKVRKVLKSQLTTIDFDSLADRCNEITEAYSEVEEVNLVKSSVQSEIENLKNEFDTFKISHQNWKKSISTNFDRVNRFRNNFNRQRYQPRFRAPQTFQPGVWQRQGQSYTNGYYYSNPRQYYGPNSRNFGPNFGPQVQKQQFYRAQNRNQPSDKGQVKKPGKPNNLAGRRGLPRKDSERPQFADIELGALLIFTGNECDFLHFFRTLHRI